jgi:serine/threonine protein kinase
VAIKVLPQALSLDADRMRRFEQEALATAALNHPNILAVFDIGTSEGSPYVVSELLEGETLRERLRSGSIATRKAWTTPCKSRMDWPRPMKKESFIATSSRRICSSPKTGGSRFWTSASRN